MGIKKTSNEMLSDSYDRAGSQPISCCEYSEDTYYVFNADTQNEYFVTVDNNTQKVLSCTCPHYIYRLSTIQIPCKHMVAVAYKLGYTC